MKNSKKSSPRVYQSSTSESENDYLKENFKSSSKNTISSNNLSGSLESSKSKSSKSKSNTQDIFNRNFINSNISFNYSESNKDVLSDSTDSNTNTDSNSNTQDMYNSNISSNKKYKTKDINNVIFMYANTIKKFEKIYAKQKSRYNTLNKLIEDNLNNKSDCNKLLDEKNNLKKELKKSKIKMAYLLNSFADINLKMANDIN